MDDLSDIFVPILGISFFKGRGDKIYVHRRILFACFGNNNFTKILLDVTGISLCIYIILPPFSKRRS